MGVDSCCRRRCAETLEAEYDSVIADPAIPRHRVRGFYRDTLNSLRQHATAIRFVLAGEELVAWHADCARTDAVSFQPLLRVENESHFRAARDENHFGRTARRISENVGPSREPGRRRVLRPVDERQFLSSQHQSDRTLFMLERNPPGLGGL